jgi:hypothetical protein
MKQFSEFAQATGPLEGEKTKLDDVINKRVIIHGFKISKSKYRDNRAADGQYLTIQLCEEGSEDMMVIFTGSSVLRDQCQQYEDQMPFATIIKKINQYYTFT